jgi:DNA-directed RNA polymerase subunit omega
MARVTVEDCIVRLPDFFNLVLLGAHRARQLGRGSTPTVPTNQDKRTVLALREIAAATVSPQALEDSLVAGLQALAVEPDDVEPDTLSSGQMMEHAYAAGMAAMIPHADMDLRERELKRARTPPRRPSRPYQA